MMFFKGLIERYRYNITNYLTEGSNQQKSKLVGVRENEHT